MANVVATKNTVIFSLLPPKFSPFQAIPETFHFLGGEKILPLVFLGGFFVIIPETFSFFFRKKNRFSWWEFLSYFSDQSSGIGGVGGSCVRRHAGVADVERGPPLV
jgi:hypothetical protein